MRLRLSFARRTRPATLSASQNDTNIHCPFTTCPARQRPPATGSQPDMHPIVVVILHRLHRRPLAKFLEIVAAIAALSTDLACWPPVRSLGIFIGSRLTRLATLPSFITPSCSAASAAPPPVPRCRAPRQNPALLFARQAEACDTASEHMPLAPCLRSLRTRAAAWSAGQGR